MRDDVFNDSLPSMELVKGFIDNKIEYELAQHEVMTQIKAKREQSSHEAVERARYALEEQAHSRRLQQIADERDSALDAARESHASEETIAAIRKKASEEQAKIEEDLRESREKHERELRSAQERDTLEVASIAIKVAQEQYNKSSIYRRAAFQEQRQQQASVAKEGLKSALLLAQTEKKELLKKKSQLTTIANDTNKSDVERMAAAAELSTIVDEISKKESEISSTKEEVKKVSEAEMDALKKKLQLEQTISRVQGLHLSKADALKKINEEIHDQKQVQEELQVQIEANLRDGLDTSELEERLAAVSENLSGLEDIQRDTLARNKKDDATKKAVDKKAQELRDQRAEEKAANDEQAAAEWKNAMSKEGMKDAGQKAMADAISGLGNALADGMKQIDGNIDSFYEYQASVEARLQGSDESYKKLLKSVTQNVALSPFIQQKKVVENIRKLVDQGVAYNVDLRAFLATVSEDIATTFDAFDSNLLRIIRLQQADTTAARLGMEASLTKLFNEFFSDTSYLSEAFDTVSGAILDASSLLSRDQSTAFDYIVQKWLGALYSVGLSDSAVSTIAEGINMLGTGNVEGLNSNDSLQTLMAMSAAKAGISYADILTGGLDADITNSLLKSMVEYLQSIANNTENNQVTKASYANLFGISTTDLRAISNLSQADISNLYSQTLSYGDAMTELNEQFGQISTRVHASQWVDNIIDNALVGAATGIGNNMALYGTWKVLNIIEDLTGGIAIPGISVFGNMVDLHQTVTGLAKIPIAGLGLMGSLLGGLFSGGGVGNTFNLKAWGFDESTSRGGNYKAITKGTASGVSESSSLGMVGSASASDVKATSMSDGASSAEEDAKTTNASVEGNSDVYENILKALSNDDGGIIDVAFEIKGIMTTTLAESLSQISDNVTSVEELLGTSILESTNQLVGLSTSINGRLDEDRLFLTTNASMGDTFTQLLRLLSPDRVFYTRASAGSSASGSEIEPLMSLLLTDMVVMISDTSVKEAIAGTISSSTISGVSSVVNGLMESTVATTVGMESIQMDNHANTEAITTVLGGMSNEIESSIAYQSATSLAMQSLLDSEASNLTAFVSNATNAVDNIEHLSNEIALDSREMRVEVNSPEEMSVSIKSMSDEIKNSITKSLTDAIISSLINGDDDNDDSVSLADKIANALRGLEVNIVNDAFDAYLQKYTYQN